MGKNSRTFTQRVSAGELVTFTPPFTISGRVYAIKAMTINGLSSAFAVLDSPVNLEVDIDIDDFRFVDNYVGKAHENTFLSLNQEFNSTSNFKINAKIIDGAQVPSSLAVTFVMEEVRRDK